MQGLSNRPIARPRQGAKRAHRHECTELSEATAVPLASRARLYHLYEMTRFLTRTLALLLLAAGFAALVIDGVRSIAGSRLVVTAFGEMMYRVFPQSFPKLQPVVEQRLHPVVWDPFLLSFFLTPAWVVLGFLGLLLFWLARPRHTIGVDPSA